ncbi:hypothetical protein GCM10009853_069600 [Glycomyces scopariae]
MRLQDDDPGAAFRALPDLTPPPAAFDLDAIVRDGYKARRRHRAVLTGASATSVAAIAAVLAFSAGLLPVGPDGDDVSGPPAGESGEHEGGPDPALSGYPWPGYDGFGDEAVAEQLTEAGREAFGNLLIATGLFAADDFRSTTNEPTEEEIQLYADELGLTFEEAEAELTYEEDGGLFVFSGNTTPGNYGQVQLYGYRAWVLGSEDPESGAWTQHLLTVETLLPGGWTAEPGPTSEQFFPQHLIDDDVADFATTDLDDGRVLYTADDQCELAVAVVYPNGSALRATWDKGCAEGGVTTEVDPAVLEAAALAMPEIDYSTEGLSEIDEVLEVPTGWLESDRSWEEWADDGAQATGEAVEARLAELLPGSTLGEPSASLADPWAFADPDTVRKHQYSMHASVPFTTTIDTTVDDASADLVYTLPGGWLPGFNEPGQEGPFLADCSADFTCTEREIDGRTAYIAERRETISADGDSGDGPRFEGEYEVTVVDPDGWAVSAWVQFGNEDFELSSDELAEVLAQLPAPVYDEDLEPVLGD